MTGCVRGGQDRKEVGLPRGLPALRGNLRPADLDKGVWGHRNWKDNTLRLSYWVGGVWGHPRGEVRGHLCVRIWNSVTDCDGDGEQKPEQKQKHSCI